MLSFFMSAELAFMHFFNQEIKLTKFRKRMWILAFFQFMSNFVATKQPPFWCLQTQSNRQKQGIRKNMYFYTLYGFFLRS
jgi:hypothetical protein